MYKASSNHSHVDIKIIKIFDYVQINGFIKHFNNAKTMLFNPNLGGRFCGLF